MVGQLTISTFIELSEAAKTRMKLCWVSFEKSIERILARQKTQATVTISHDFEVVTFSCHDRTLRFQWFHLPCGTTGFVCKNEEFKFCTAVVSPINAETFLTKIIVEFCVEFGVSNVRFFDNNIIETDSLEFFPPRYARNCVVFEKKCVLQKLVSRIEDRGGVVTQKEMDEAKKLDVVDELYELAHLMTWPLV